MRVPEARTQSIAASSAPPSTEVHQGQMPLREMIRLRARSAAEGRHVLAQDVPGEGVELVELVEVPAVLRACHRHHHQWGTPSGAYWAWTVREVMSTLTLSIRQRAVIAMTAASMA